MPNKQIFYDFSKLKPQRKVLESYPERPNASSGLYIQHVQEGKKHTEVGVRIVVQKDHPNGIWNKYACKEGAKKNVGEELLFEHLIFACDVLEVHDEFHVPETKVSILAREIIWASDDASINTTPLPWLIDTPLGEDGKAGKDGANAGTIIAPVLRVSYGKQVNDSKVRLLAAGGNGQNAGAGKNGKDGDNRSYVKPQHTTKMSNNGGVTTTYHMNFPFPAVYLKEIWHSPIQDIPREYGVAEWPLDGENAISAGRPGSGGNGATLETNCKSLINTFENTAGKSGTAGTPYYGGAAGLPRESAHYEINLDVDSIFGGEFSDRAPTMTAGPHTTKAGTDALTAPQAERPEGLSPAPKPVAITDAWLHPLSLQKALEYARDLFLAGDRAAVREMLADYQQALTAELPPQLDCWQHVPLSDWVSAQCEVASMLSRLHSHLDYFGNPGGFIPVLSLQASVQLYKEQTEHAFRSLLLARWINKHAEDKEQRVKALQNTIESLAEDSQQAAEAVVKTDQQIIELKKKITTVADKMRTVHQQLTELQNNLKAEAKTNEEAKKIIQATTSVAATLCMVIPVGQPVLGAIGGLAQIGADYALDETDGLEALKGVGDNLTSMAGKMVSKAEAAKKAAKESRKSKTAEEEADAAALERANKQADAVKGTGKIFSEAASLIGALQVSDLEVEAELQKLKAASPEWKKIAQEIEELNKLKAGMSYKLGTASENLNANVARMVSNASAIYRMRQESATTASAMSPEATGFVNKMAQRSRHLLVKYLYLMVKSYESTTFEQLEVDWGIDKINNKVLELVDNMEAGSEFTINSTLTDELRPLYEANLAVVREQLLNYLSKESFTTISRNLKLSKKTTPELLERLNKTSSVSIDPIAQSLLLPNYHLARLSNITLKNFKFEEKDGQKPDIDNFTVSIWPKVDGTMRRREHLYAVTSSNTPLWSRNYSSSEQLQKLPKDSSQMEDMLTFIVGEGSDSVKNKLSMPPLWSDYEIKLEEMAGNGHQLEEIEFTFEIEQAAIRDPQHVLFIHSNSDNASAVIQCAPKDLAERGAGLNTMVRIYQANSEIKLSAPLEVEGKKFVSWHIWDSNEAAPRIEASSEITLSRLNNNVTLMHNWEPL